MKAIAAQSIATITEFMPRDLASMAGAFASIEVFDETLFDALASSSIAKRTQFSAQQLCKTAWACSTLGFAACPLLDAISA